MAGTLSKYSSVAQVEIIVICILSSLVRLSSLLNKKVLRASCQVDMVHSFRQNSKMSISGHGFGMTESSPPLGYLFLCQNVFCLGTLHPLYSMYSLFFLTACSRKKTIQDAHKNIRSAQHEQNCRSVSNHQRKLPLSKIHDLNVIVFLIINLGNSNTKSYHDAKVILYVK